MQTRPVRASFFLLAALCTVQPLAAEPVGRTSALIPAASQQPPQAPAGQLNLNDPILRNALLSTAKGGALEVTFADNSKLSMGADSQVVVDEFAYAGPGAAGSQSLSFGKGVFRFISGAVPKPGVKLQTPVATIGIRGTVLRIKNGDDRTSIIGVEADEEGRCSADVKATVTAKDGGQSVELRPCQYVTVSPSGSLGAILQGQVPGCN
jgi:hypothetical protein